MNQPLAAREIHPLIDTVFPFAETVAAYRRLESQRHVGKVSHRRRQLVRPAEPRVSLLQPSPSAPRSTTRVHSLADCPTSS